ncbi:MAG: winged helix-turn-helix transcriptional regulator [Deltaproteobacteria bacterium]|nr:winged helix-turn-helix transcriptional regulator [Deltaproteobacteria bacterium]
MNTKQLYISPLKTKLFPPLERQKHLLRSALQINADEAKNLRLYFVNAPAGYGKSNLLIQWKTHLEQAGFKTAWLSLDSHDNDVTVLVEYLLASLAGIDNSIGKKARAAYQSGSLTTAFPLLESLLNDLEEVSEPIALFWDDFHYIQEPECLSMIEFFIKHLPKQITLIIASRENAQIDLSRYLLSEQLKTVSAKNLRFTHSEIQEFFSKLKHIELSETALNIIENKSEGWIAALQLLSLLLQKGYDAQQIISNFSGANRMLSDYLAKAVLDSLEIDVRNFLIKLSQLDRFCADLAANVTGENQAQQYLEDLESDNIFLIPLDSNRTWYRFHHLFRDFLHHQLKLSFPQELPRLALSAAHWFKAQNLGEEAIQQALQSEDPQLAVHLINEFIMMIHRQGHYYSVTHWLEQLPPAVYENNPIVRMTYANALIYCSRLEKAAKELQAAKSIIQNLEKQHLLEEPERSFILTVFGIIQCMYAMFRDDYKNWRAPIEQIFNKCSGQLDTHIEASICVHLAIACSLSYDFKLGESLIKKIKKAVLEVSTPYVKAMSVSVDAQIQVAQGKLQKIIADIEEANTVTSEQLQFDPHSGSILFAQGAEIYYELGEIKKAESYIKNCIDKLEIYGLVNPTKSAYRALARLWYFEGKLQLADSILCEGEELGQQRQTPRLTYTLAAERIAMHLREGNLEKAQSIDSEYSLSRGEFKIPEGMEHIFTELSELTQVRLLRFQAKHSTALQILSKIEQRVEKQGRLDMKLRLKIIKSDLLLQQKQKSQGLELLQEALNLAATEGYVTVFWEEAPKQQKHIFALLDQNNTPHNKLYHQRFFSVFNRKNTQNKLTAAAKEVSNLESFSESSLSSDEHFSDFGLFDPLTKRELEIIEHLESDLTNQEIAQKLFISVGTLKWHLNNIYSKLGVRQRSGAIALIKKLRGKLAI